MPIFDPIKCYNPLSPPVLSARLFSVLQVENHVNADVAEIQEAATDKLKEFQKEEFSAVLRNCTTTQKPVYVQMELIWNLEKGMSSSFVLGF